MKMIRKRNWLAVLITGILLLMMFPTSVFAYQTIDVDAKCTLTITAPVPGMTVKAYYVESVTENGEYSVRDKYLPLGIEIRKDFTQEEWMKAASTYASQLSSGTIEAEYGGTVGEDKTLALSGLVPGMYLIIAEPFSTEETTYTVTPNFIAVPNSEDGINWIYDVTMMLKYEEMPVEKKDVSYSVRKVWTGESDVSARPAGIKISINRRSTEGGAAWETVETVTLNAANNWAYSWTAADDGKTEWAVSEESVSGYTLQGIGKTVSEDGKNVTFTVTNKKSTPGKTPTLTPTRGSTGTTSKPKTGDDQNMILPLVGMIVAAVVILFAGIGMRRKN